MNAIVTLVIFVICSETSLSAIATLVILSSVLRHRLVP